MDKTKAHIFLAYATETAEPQIYIVPNDVLLSRFGEKSRKTVYTPVNGYSNYNNIRAKTDFNQFLDNWEILSTLKEPNE